jgi:hypothetical protein
MVLWYGGEVAMAHEEGVDREELEVHAVSGSFNQSRQLVCVE